MPGLRHLLARVLNRVTRPLQRTRYGVPLGYRLARLEGCEPELVELHRLGPNRGVAIDVGANEGLFSYRLSQLYDQVHAFEINPRLAARLTRWHGRGVTVHDVGLSSHVGEGQLHVPLHHGRQLTGWGSLETNHCPGVEEYEHITVRFRPLDTFNLQGVTFVKADVEGHEVELLAGAVETFKRNRPVVLLEVKDANWPAVRKFFADLGGYREQRLVDVTGTAGTNENVLFIPDAVTLATATS